MPAPPDWAVPAGRAPRHRRRPGSPSVNGDRRTGNVHRRAGLTDLQGPDLDEDALLNYEIDAEESAWRPSRFRWKGTGRVVREKLHQAEPMTIDRALLEMEHIGHDFYLFHDRDCGLFSVVYRRRGYDYGVIGLEEGSA